jgi:hypothetical protein
VTRCPNYPYFSDTPFRLALTINTTRKAYVKSEFQAAVSTAAQLGDPNRVYVESTVDLPGGSLIHATTPSRIARSSTTLCVVVSCVVSWSVVCVVGVSHAIEQGARRW